MARGKYERTSIPGVYKYPTHYRMIVTVGGQNFESRWPLSTTDAFLKAQRPRYLAQMEQDHPALMVKGRDRTAGPTVQRAIDLYLQTQPHTVDAAGVVIASAKYKYAKAACAHWAAALDGWRPLADVTDAQILAAVAQWTAHRAAGTPGHAAASVNKRRYMLRAMYRLALPAGKNRADVVPHQREPRPQPRDVPIAIIQAIVDAMPDTGRAVAGGTRGPSLAKLRIRLMAETGFPPAVIKRIDPGHVDRAAMAVYVLGRRKGRYELPAEWISVTPAAMDVLDDIAAASAWGRFSSRSLAQSFARAVATAKDRWDADSAMPWDVPPGIRAYDLRHAYLSAFQHANGGNLVATGRAALHAPGSRQTDRYIVKTVSPAQQAGAAALAKLRPAVYRKPAPAANVVQMGAGRRPSRQPGGGR